MMALSLSSYSASAGFVHVLHTLKTIVRLTDLHTMLASQKLSPEAFNLSLPHPLAAEPQVLFGNLDIKINVTPVALASFARLLFKHWETSYDRNHFHFIDWCKQQDRDLWGKMAPSHPAPWQRRLNSCENCQLQTANLLFAIA